MHFCDVQLSSGDEHILQNICQKQHALLVDVHVFSFFASSNFHFFPQKRSGPNWETLPISGNPCCEVAPLPPLSPPLLTKRPKEPHSDRKGGPKGAPFRVFARGRRPTDSRTPCMWPRQTSNDCQGWSARAVEKTVSRTPRHRVLLMGRPNQTSNQQGCHTASTCTLVQRILRI